MEIINVYGLESFISLIFQYSPGTSLVVQWVRFRAPNAGGPGSILDWEAGSLMHAATKMLRAATKTWLSLKK